jgi:transposase
MQPTQEQYVTRDDEVLAVSLELASKSWKVGLDDGKRKSPAVHGVDHAQPQGRLEQAIAVIEKAKKKWGLSPGVRVVVVYEAGQDGFWIQRALTARGYEALVVDAASIPVERKSRRAKTDRLDTIRLVLALRGWLRGERDRMKVVRVPAVEAEGQRHLVRERGTLQKEIGQHRDRLRKLLGTMGCWESIEGDLKGRLERGEVKGYGGSALPVELQERLVRECRRLKLVEEQLAQLEKTLPGQLPEAVHQRVVQLMQLKAVGPVGAQRLLLELFWRQFNNRREVGACVGLVPQPYDSGESRVDQGISKAGNRRVRALLIEMAWLWLRWQAQSELAQWFAKRTSGTGSNKRNKRIAIVAVARRLVILLWRYLKHGVLPKDVVFKPVKVKLKAA